MANYSRPQGQLFTSVPLVETKLLNQTELKVPVNSRVSPSDIRGIYKVSVKKSCKFKLNLPQDTIPQVCNVEFL